MPGQIDQTSSKKRTYQKLRAEELLSKFSGKRGVFDYLTTQW